MHLGVNADTRTDTQKEFDYKHDELFAKSSSVGTYLGSRAEASSYVGVFPTDNQYGTSSCVAHGKVLVMSIFNYLQGDTQRSFVQLASMFIYRNRINYPTEGMIPSSANMQTIKAGAPPYADMPTPQTEAEANAMAAPDAATTLAAKQFSAGKWVQLIDPTDIDTMAFVAGTLGLPLNILIYATEEEWSKSTVEVITAGLQRNDPAAVVSHCITVLPKSAYIAGNGKRYVIIQDSALFGDITYRAVSEDFIAERCYESDYMVAVGSQPAPTRPTVDLTQDLTVGMQSDQVTQLQQALQYLGYLPNVVNGAPFAPTGYYGGMTKNAVLALQNAYASVILAPSGLTAGTGYCGAATRTFLNTMFA